jgi:abhydrolase domain-containing protein 6
MLTLTLLLSGCATVEDGLFALGREIGRACAGVDARSVEVAGQRIHYLVRRPDAEEVVVLVHGYGVEKDTWLWLIRELPEDLGIYAVDLPGHGDNERDWDASYRVADLLEGLSRTVDALGLESFHLMGSSLGGKLAIRYAAQQPGRVRTLALLSPAALHPPRPSDVERALAEGENPLIARSRKELDDLLDLLFYDPPFMPWPVRRVLTRRAIERAEFSAMMWAQIWTQRREVHDVLHQLTMPVLVLWGREDRVVDVSAVGVFREYLPHGCFVVMEKAGHAPMVERPKETAEHYRTFLRRSASSEGVILRQGEQGVRGGRRDQAPRPVRVSDLSCEAR